MHSIPIIPLPTMSTTPIKPNKPEFAQPGPAPEGVNAPTLFDVARLANVSPSTVSRIINGSAKVSSERKRAVEEAIRLLKFRPNFSAKSLRSGSTMTIGVLTQDFDSLYFARALKGIEKGLEGSGYAPLVIPGHWNPAEEAERMRLLMARKVDAIAVLGGSLRDSELVEFARMQPIVVTGRKIEGHQLRGFHFDHVRGALMATQHLIERGHTRIAYIAGPRAHPDALDRTEGFFQAHRQAQLPFNPALMVEGDYQEAGGDAAMVSLLDSGIPFTAVFCANDQTLWGARMALYRLGRAVPGEFSLVGFDDLPQSQYMTPPVTTVHQPIFELGLAAAQSLLQALGAELEAEPALVEPYLVLRETTRAL
ncbi:MAG: LacI family DNA-binding transcriptional regulator [Rhodoferax sp.]|nr:LacI family DNA-binding transcriptional regulator [Rhodoferax sp.]